MGYSYSIQCRDDESHKRLLEVLGQHKPYSEITGEPEPSPHEFHDDIDMWDDATEELVLMPRAAGIHCVSLGGDAAGVYYWTLLRWAAMKAGTHRTEFTIDNELHIYPKPVPFTIYDGVEPWPVLLDTDPDLKDCGPDWCRFDDCGVQVDPSKRCERVALTIMLKHKDVMEALKEAGPSDTRVYDAVKKLGYLSEADAIFEGIRTEIRRLDALW